MNITENLTIGCPHADVRIDYLITNDFEFILYYLLNQMKIWLKGKSNENRNANKC